uniref:Uncharacterized protein n=1 Tax=Oryza glumipatula TaxID=40148 RepID=A0A0D9ZHN5_9ORYZ
MTVSEPDDSGFDSATAASLLALRTSSPPHANPLPPAVHLPFGRHRGTAIHDLSVVAASKLRAPSSASMPPTSSLSEGSAECKGRHRRALAAVERQALHHNPSTQLDGFSSSVVLHGDAARAEDGSRGAGGRWGGAVEVISVDAGSGNGTYLNGHAKMDEATDHETYYKQRRREANDEQRRCRLELRTEEERRRLELKRSGRRAVTSSVPRRRWGWRRHRLELRRSDAGWN